MRGAQWYGQRSDVKAELSQRKPGQNVMIYGCFSAPPEAACRQRLAPNDSPSPNEPPTRDRHAPEPRDACPSPTSQPVTIQRHDGPASHAAQASVKYTGNGPLQG